MTTLRVNTFPGPQNIALFVAREKGFFAKRGLSVEIAFTPSSSAQREGLAAGRFEIAQSGVDNAVALVEAAKVDAVVIAGGSNGMNEFMVRPEIATLSDMRGKTLVVDAPNTSFAFLAYKMLSLHGLGRGDYAVLPAGGCPQRLAAMRSSPANAGAMLNLPCNVMAEREGFRSLGNAVAAIGPYQADAPFVLRSFAAANGETLVHYLAAAIEGYRFAAAPENRAETDAIAARILGIERDIAAKANERALAGLARDLAVDFEGFRGTLKLRAEFDGGDPDAKPEKYLDLTWYRKALATM